MKFKIRQFRTAQGISQELLSRRSGVARCVLSALESGESVNVEVATLEKIARALNTRVGNLLEEDLSPKTALTCELVSELATREGVTSVLAEPYKDAEIKINGPATILVVTD